MPPAAIDRHRDRIDDLRHQRHRADLGADVVAQEHGAVSARFRTLGDDHVASVVLEPARLTDRRRRRDHRRARRPHPIDQRLLRQSEVEAHHVELQLLDGVAQCFVEPAPARERLRPTTFDPQLLVVGRESLPPGIVASSVVAGRRMGEEVDVHRTVRPRPYERDLLANLVRREQRARHRAETAGLAHGHRELDAARSGHRRLHDRQFDPEQRRQPGLHWVLPPVRNDTPPPNRTAPRRGASFAAVFTPDQPAVDPR